MTVAGTGGVLKNQLTNLRIRHRTTYRYRVPVVLGPHRLLLRPRDGRELRVVISEIVVKPGAPLHWASDVFGNSVASSYFGIAADTLVIESASVIELSAASYPVFDIAASALAYPFRYSDDERIDLGPLAVCQFHDDAQLRFWAASFIAAHPTDTLALLKDVNIGIADRVVYEARDNEGTQSPNETLSLGRGSCRDLATLFVEAVRSLGFGARIVSGYLHDPSRTRLGSLDAGSTHAWAEVFLPGAGWITFDPTNRRMGSAELIPVAVGRDIRQVMPVVGTYSGPADALAEMAVEVTVG